MNKLKSISVVLFAAVLAGVVISCKEEDKTDLKAEGKKAGTEMCSCVASYDEPNPTDFMDGEGNFDEAGFSQAFGAYAMQLSTCLGVVTQYQDYVDFVYENYDPTADEPLYSVFIFKNSDFEHGFKEGTSGCKEAFDALFAMMGAQ